MSRNASFSFYEFFAGGGMARAGLGEGWRCLFANDFDPLKARVYRDNWGGEDLKAGDIWGLEAADLPGRADLAWASSPCQDLSLAGARAGLDGGRSSALWGFWRLIEALDDEGRAPRILVVENVVGLLTSNAGADFEAFCAALAERGYRFGAVEVDAAAFVPQSRPRVFVIAAHDPVFRSSPRKRGSSSFQSAVIAGQSWVPAFAGMTGRGEGPFHTRAVVDAFERLPPPLREHWLWWRLPPPPPRNTDFAALLEPDHAVSWHTPAQTVRLISLMSGVHLAKLREARAREGRTIGALYRRVRSEAGVKRQRAEVRFDGLAGCLRTPRGGSSRQTVVVVEDGAVRTRLLSAREGARLMGLSDDYRLPPRATAGLSVVGDGVAVPVVRHLARHLLEPLLAAASVPAAAE